jgi:hypothetical protein
MAPHESGINISGVTNSAVAVGANARADNRTAAVPGRDQATEELLQAVRELRADLTRVRASEETAALDTALAETEEEIVTTGQAGPTRRDRLRALLDDSQALVGLVASAGAVAGLLGL